jgi:hypothetical protein
MSCIAGALARGVSLSVSVPFGVSVLACFDPQWPNLKTAVAYFDFEGTGLGMSFRLKFSIFATTGRH